MVHIGICQKNAGDGSVARRIVARVQRRHGFDVTAQIRRRVDQPPTLRFFRISADRDARLRLRFNCSCACRGAVGTRTIPLRQAAAGRAAENMDANQPEFRSD